MAEKNRNIRDRLFTVYKTLPPFEQTLLQLLSVVFEPVSKTAILNCLRRADIAGPKGQRLILSSLTPHLTTLQELGLLDQQYRCHEAVVELLSREAVRHGSYEAMVRAVQTELPVSYNYGKGIQRCRRLIRELRIGIYTLDILHIENITPLIPSQCPSSKWRNFPVVRACVNPFQAEWLAMMPPSFKFYIIDKILAYSLQCLDHLEGPVAYLEHEVKHGTIPDPEKLPFYRLLTNYLIWRGNLAEAQDLINRCPESFSSSGLSGCIHFLQGENDLALARFEADLKHLGSITGDKKVFFCNTSGIFFILALLKTGDSSCFDRIRKYIAAVRTQPCEEILLKVYTLLETIVPGRKNDFLTPDATFVETTYQNNSILSLFAALSFYWRNGHLPKEMIDESVRCFKAAQTHGFTWLAMEFAELLNQLGGSDHYGEYSSGIREASGLVSIIEAVKLQESWQRSLTALIAFSSSSFSKLNERKQTRLAWLVGHDGRSVTISPREQKLTANGHWSKGRPVALGRLYAEKNLPFLTEQDRQVIHGIKRKQTSLETIYFFDMDIALPAMIGHPLLFSEKSPRKPVEFLKGEPELLVEETDGWIRLSFLKEIEKEGITVFRESPTHFKIIQLSDKYRHVADIIGENGLTVPLAARKQVMDAIGNISSFMTVHSAIGGKSANIAEVPADARIYVQLFPFGLGFKLEMFVKPFKTGGPYLKPGIGVEFVMAEIGGRRLQTRRNLNFEEENALRSTTVCPTLSKRENINRVWHLPNPEDCLQVLFELKKNKDDITVEWPEGERLAISHQASFDQLHLKIRNHRKWFEISGELRVNKSLVLDMKKLVKLVAKGRKRFIPLGAGQFLALTKELHRRLKELVLFSEQTSEHDNCAGILVRPLAALALEDLTENLKHLDADEGWLSQVQLIKEARELEPEIPPALKADLRDYQVEGYNWLARLAHWGVGACLADDMGLGKTLQALAIILARAQYGPTLVVAPTSVCMNWQEETRRFAPRLNILTLGSKDRKKLLKSLQGFDILITSYTLLQQEAKLLAAKEWQTIVLDESQAIKNMTTKRSRAAMLLNGRFKLITTGTPIENRLSELWNLFHFITPGLLHSLDKFNEDFAVPIERYQDDEARNRLKKLIRPFILRRTKSQVLDELPPRTEIVLHVEMNDEETAFYEALRRQALENLKNFDPGKGKNRKGYQPGQNMQILAEIMKLRRACCNARLVLPEASIASSKQALFAKVVDELLENQHKVLVFSQFVGHLAIIREFLDREQVDYRYLDGSTPIKERKKEVEAFQAGHGDLFLISLKAGGLGLNLTAADYVIHMDPWWNPAVEDQASDRAHRIGQNQPVTIYRLVTKNTIEEKIVKLHQEKRDLADSLLEGSYISAGMSTEELVNMIREH